MEDTDLKTRRRAIQQIVDAAKPQHEPEVQAAIDTYEEARAKTREAPMLEMRFADRRVACFDYGSLEEAWFLSDGKFTLRFGRKQIIAEGKNLRRLFDTIIEHRQRFICEGTGDEEASKPEDAAHIDKITIQRVSEDQL
jgi:hypothetical protein